MTVFCNQGKSPLWEIQQTFSLQLGQPIVSKFLNFVYINSEQYVNHRHVHITTGYNAEISSMFLFISLSLMEPVVSFISKSTVYW